MKHRFRRWRIVLRKVLRRIVFSQSSASSIAWGVALGVFIGLTPTVGFQMIIAAFLATLFRMNRLAAILPVWISNPFTIAPIYYFDFRVGAMLLRVEKASRVREDFAAVAERFAEVSIADFFATMSAALGEMGRLGFDILAPLAVGSFIVGTVAAAVTYPVALWTVAFVRRRRRVYSIRRAERRLERLERDGLYYKTDTGSWKPVERGPAEEKAEEPEEARELQGPKPLGPIRPGGGRAASPDEGDVRPGGAADGSRSGG